MEPLSFSLDLYIDDFFDEYDLDKIKEWLDKDD